MKNLSTDAHPHDPRHDKELMELLKQAEDPKTNEDETLTASNPDAYPGEVPPEEDGIDGSWGDEQKPVNGQQDVINFSNPVAAQIRASREEFLNRFFDKKDESEKADHKLMSESLDHFSSGQFETAKPMLKDKSKMSKMGSPTLMASVQELLGRK